MRTDPSISIWIATSRWMTVPPAAWRAIEWMSNWNSFTEQLNKKSLKRASTPWFGVSFLETLISDPTDKKRQVKARSSLQSKMKLWLCQVSAKPGRPVLKIDVFIPSLERSLAVSVFFELEYVKTARLGKDLRYGVTYYYATASFQCIRMQTTTCDLPTALEYVVILTAVKEWKDIDAVDWTSNIHDSLTQWINDAWWY